MRRDPQTTRISTQRRLAYSVDTLTSSRPFNAADYWGLVSVLEVASLRVRGRALAFKWSGLAESDVLLDPPGVPRPAPAPEPDVVVSRAGAQQVAQGMPGQAQDRGRLVMG